MFDGSNPSADYYLNREGIKMKYIIERASSSLASLLLSTVGHILMTILAMIHIPVLCVA